MDAEAYLKRGEVSAGAHEYDRAIADYNLAIQLKPDYAEAYNDRGYAYYLKGNNSDRAIADFTRAIELRPNYPTAYNNRGVIYMPSGYGGRERFPTSIVPWSSSRTSGRQGSTGRMHVSCGIRCSR